MRITSNELIGRFAFWRKVAADHGGVFVTDAFGPDMVMVTADAYWRLANTPARRVRPAADDRQAPENPDDVPPASA